MIVVKFPRLSTHAIMGKLWINELNCPEGLGKIIAKILSINPMFSRAKWLI